MRQLRLRNTAFALDLLSNEPLLSVSCAIQYIKVRFFADCGVMGIK
jgi:hypothetical protein